MKLNIKVLSVVKISTSVNSTTGSHNSVIRVGNLRIEQPGGDLCYTENSNMESENGSGETKTENLIKGIKI